jgi:hypothetical protein
MAVRPKEQLTNHPNHTNPGFFDRVGVHATHNHEHDCLENSILYRGCTQTPWLTIILCSQSSIDPMEYLYTLSGCTLGYHYGFSMASSSLQRTRWGFIRGVTPGPPRAPCCTVWFLGEFTPLPTHSQPGRSIESPLYPLHQLVCQTSLCHILCQTVPI